MIRNLFSKIFQNRNSSTLKSIKKIVNIINKLETQIQKLSDKQLSYKTEEFRKRLRKGCSLESLLPEAFAVVREASNRICGMRHYDVQLIGGIILNNRCVAEMLTGEGKTLTSTLPAYLNALNNKGVHIVTVNDYLAKRDAKNNTPLFEFLGLSVGINMPYLSNKEKRDIYASDIIYGTNNEYGFDYLRDNLALNPKNIVQKKLNYALLDEVDSILIDEARTPLIISENEENISDIYYLINKLIPYLVRQETEDSYTFKGTGDFTVDEKYRQVNLTERGLKKIEKLLFKNGLIQSLNSLYSIKNIRLMYYITAALRAHVLFFKNVDYIIKDNEIVIVDEHTGRTMPGRRWSDGLHNAVEAKENLKIKNENKTLASISFQNYFRLYKKIAGMTGTADSESVEFKYIYGLNTIVIPTNCPIIRKDLPDKLYLTEKEKNNAIIKDIKNCIKRDQPVLVGTITIEKSESISRLLNKEGIVHKVLNAKYNSKEADIIAQAGKPGAVTIATNMAGRGTDIVLGGNLQSEIAKLKNKNKKNINKIKQIWTIRHETVISAGGLHIIGTERHESRRIDNQLRGRAGRQGDVGSSRFYLSLEDPLMRIFASKRIFDIIRKMGINYGQSIENRWINKAIYNAVRKVEIHNYDIRKQILEYDDIANDQRRVIFYYRNKLLYKKDSSNIIEYIIKDVLNSVVNKYITTNYINKIWNISGLEKTLKNDFDLYIPISKWINNKLYKKKIYHKLLKETFIQYKNKENILGSNILRKFEKKIMLKTLDYLWKEHLAAMDYLRQGIHLRVYAQRNPKEEYKRESFIMFSNMIEFFKYEVFSIISKIKI